MSLGTILSMRRPTRSKSQSLKRSNVRAKATKKVKEKPPWDSTVTDLSVFKPSPKQLQRNHELHQPKKDHERLLTKFNVSKDFLQFEGYNNTGEQQKFSEIDMVESQNKEMWLLSYELHSVLAETDKTLATVKDLFGDDAQKYKGHPNITKAPMSDAQVDNLVSVIDKETSLCYDTLTASVARDSTFNSISSGNENNEDEVLVEVAQPCNDIDAMHYGFSEMSDSYKSSMKLERYEALFKDSGIINSNYISNIEMPDMNSFTEVSQNVEAVIDCNTEVEQKGDMVMLNKAEAQNNEMKRQGLGQEKQRSKGSATYSFDEMKTMLDVLENEITEYENECGKNNIAEKLKIPNTLTGYTASLLSVIIRITHHLKESEVQLHAEMSMRKEIIDAFEEQRCLIDVLTSDLLETQGRNEQLQRELEMQKRSSEKQYCHLKMEITTLQNTVNALVSSNGLKSPQMSMYGIRSQDENLISVKQSTASENSSASYTIKNNHLKDTTNLTNIQRQNKQNEKSVYNH